MAARQELIITYQVGENVTFNSAAAMRRHLQSEKEIWKPFLSELPKNNQLTNIPLNRGSTNAESLSQVFEELEKKVDDPREFNRSAQRNGPMNIMVPPTAVSLEGQLILGLFEANRIRDAQCAYLWSLDQNLGINRNSNPQVDRMTGRGETLMTAAYAASALPFRQVTSQKLAGAFRSVEANIAALNEEVGQAQSINDTHEDNLKSFRETWKDRARRIEKVVFKREKHRRELHTNWIQAIDQEVTERFSQADSKLEAVERTNRMRLTKQQEEFDRLLDLFHTQLRLRAPVKLWEGRATAHKNKSRWAFGGFLVGTVLAMAAGAAVPFLAGDYIAASFFAEICDGSEVPVCSREFSAKGPLTVAGLLLIMSVLLWAIRLQYRVYLSERHLALDASEKQAFAETYLAMKEGEDVQADNEAIVLASLFRPTQDGIIKDDETAFDLSAAAILARQLGRGNSG